MPETTYSQLVLPPSAPLLRSHLLGFMAMLDAAMTVCLVLFSIQAGCSSTRLPLPGPSFRNPREPPGATVLNLELLAFQGSNLWKAFFPEGWPSRQALAVSLGDVLLLLGVRWSLTTSEGSGAGFLLSSPGVILTAIIHSATSVYFLIKICAALELKTVYNRYRFSHASLHHAMACLFACCLSDEHRCFPFPASLTAKQITAAWAPSSP